MIFVFIIHAIFRPKSSPTPTRRALASFHNPSRACIKTYLQGSYTYTHFRDFTYPYNALPPLAHLLIFGSYTHTYTPQPSGLTYFWDIHTRKTLSMASQALCGAAAEPNRGPKHNKIELPELTSPRGFSHASDTSIGLMYFWTTEGNSDSDKDETSTQHSFLPLMTHRQLLPLPLFFPFRFKSNSKLLCYHQHLYYYLLTFDQCRLLRIQQY